MSDHFTDLYPGEYYEDHMTKNKEVPEDMSPLSYYVIIDDNQLHQGLEGSLADLVQGSEYVFHDEKSAIEVLRNDDVELDDPTLYQIKLTKIAKVIITKSVQFLNSTNKRSK